MGGGPHPPAPSPPCGEGELKEKRACRGVIHDAQGAINRAPTRKTTLVSPTAWPVAGLIVLRVGWGEEVGAAGASAGECLLAAPGGDGGVVATE